MKRVSLIGFLIILLSNCKEPATCEEQICITDSRLINEWELIQECLCHYQGGDFIWRSVTEKYIWKFNEVCKINEIGESQSNCNSGKYTIKDDMLSIIWVCTNSNTTSAEYLFSISQNGDTLTIKGLVDEGYIGQKFIKKK
jgi:hypothetical protein